MRFQYTIHHVPGKSLYIADTLSRVPLQVTADEFSFNPRETEQFMQSITATVSASNERLEFYAKAQATDKIYAQLCEFCTSGWPNQNKLSRELKQYWEEASLLPMACYYIRHAL